MDLNHWLSDVWADGTWAPESWGGEEELDIVVRRPVEGGSRGYRKIKSPDSSKLIQAQIKAEDDYIMDYIENFMKCLN